MNADQGTPVIFFGCLIVAAALLYFTPTWIAERRWHCNVNAIFALNILLGWTFLGWVIALVWSLTDNVYVEVEEEVEEEVEA